MYVTISLFILTQACASCININIHGPHYVRNGEHIWVNCSSDIVPTGQYTEFIVNGETLDSLERRATGCFSAIKRARCSSNMCHCSQDAKQYAIRVHVNQEFQNLTVECSMKFRSKGPLFAKRAKTIRVLDLSGPKIDINGAEIIVAGTKRIIRCNVMTSLILQMYWKCLTITSIPPKRYSSTLSIFAHIDAKSSDHGEICTCIVQYENFVTSTSIMLNISSPPIIQVSNTATCNQTTDAQLQCYLSGDLHYYGFGQWIHTINGKFIRKLNGTTHGNISTLFLQSCSYEDFGNYTCIAWNENNHHKYWSNKTTILTVRDLPVIADTDIITEPELQLGLLYYSIPTPVNIQWFRYGEKLENSTSYSFSSIKQSMNLQFHGISILCDGYRSSLRIAKPLYGEYLAVLKNEIGETKHEFKWESEISEHEYAKKDDDLDTISMFADIDIGADVIIPPDPSHNDSWKDGRRVIELFELAQNLVCQLCNCPLNLIDTVSERKYGLGSVLTIPCGSCTACNSVETGKRNSNGAFVVNSKAAIGKMYDTCGMGATHVNNFLAGLNVPPVHSSTIRKKEKEIGKKIQEVEASFDGGWQKRGTGWQYDSNTGHASMIGLKQARCFMYAIKENEGLTDDLREGLNRIVPHVSGDHSLCTDIEWCTYKDDPVNFKYKSLPGGKCLSNDALTSELRELVQQYNRRAESLQNMGSTQANENFNQIVGSKCPKARSYGGSSSFNSRLSAAVLQKNEGYTWLSMVNEASELSPGQFTMKVGETMNKKLERQRENQKRISFKREELKRKEQEEGPTEFKCKRRNHIPTRSRTSVKGFIDTLKLSKRVFPKADVDNYKQQTLVKKVLGIEYAAHNAKDDVLSLSELFSQKLQSSCEEDDLHHVNFNSCKLSLKPLVDKKIINAAVCFKLARSGINVTHLKLANSRDVNGIKLILKDNNVNNRYLSSIIGHFFRYYAAPEEENNVHLYNDTEYGFNQSMNASVGQYEEIPDNYQDINRQEVYERHYDVSHHYIEI
ncbi:unnamed protein product [Mytilus coruscus]|uniref:Ig-like domain-containing protein n=1 Tax=Mytilus coruscus TaxID=42192 RepID=A0A6J8BSE3_MYTCO|nr:unnamed protein product [Mytilus coruscus]